jgi:hypothetical protein
VAVAQKCMIKIAKCGKVEKGSSAKSLGSFDTYKREINGSTMYLYGVMAREMYHTSTSIL